MRTYLVFAIDSTLNKPLSLGICCYVEHSSQAIAQDMGADKLKDLFGYRGAVASIDTALIPRF